MISRRIEEDRIRRAKQLLDDAEKVTVVCHTGPDGDAIGSSLAAMHVFGAIGKDVKVVIPDTASQNLQTLPGYKEIVDAAKYYDFACRLIREADVILCLDFNEPNRCGRLADALKDSTAPKILVDHHLHPSIDADVVISHPEMAATAYLLFRFLCRLELFNFIDRKAAECILAGMMTDTGNFSYNSNDPELYIVAAELIHKGADKERLTIQLFNTFSADCLRLNAYAILEKMEINTEAGCSLIALSRDELNRYHYQRGDTEGLVNRPLAIPGVRFSVFMRQESDCIRVSMRSRDDFPVNELCRDYFGGGGHLNAAGGEFYDGTLDDAVAYFRSKLPEIIEKYPLKRNNG
ncbi:MAG: DHH family phosphoesterase [Muribaculaceae bacterium]|nr:DHH family phosphoesterase [Muribaculaceae bacterium]